MIKLAVWICLMKASCTTQLFDGPEVETHLPNDVILEWNEITYHAFGGKAYQHSLMASRINAMTHLAMHDALNTIYPVYGRYAYSGLATYANPIAAAANVAYTVLAHEIPDKREYLDSALEKSLSGVPESSSKEKLLE